MNQKTKDFIVKNADADIHQLSLQSARITNDVDMPLALRQIAGRQKIRHKVPYFFQTEELLYPVQLSLEQSSSETTALYKSSLCSGTCLVDLTGGFGVDCWFMSTGFENAVYVEQQEELCRLAINNFNALGRKHISVIHADSENYLLEMEQVDWIFIDPARRNTVGKKVVLLSDCEPDLSKLWPMLLKKGKQVMIKLSPMMDIAAALRELPHTKEIHILAVENECKEILLIMNSKSEQNTTVKTVNFGKNNQTQNFDFILSDEANCVAEMSEKPDIYLYEPNAAAMKSGAFKLISNRLKVQKLHTNTHLYTSSEPVTDFPGRIFRIQKVWNNQKTELKQLSALYPKANIAVRNYPLSVEELRKKLKIKDGGDTYLFACTIANDNKVILECEKCK